MYFKKKKILIKKNSYLNFIYIYKELTSLNINNDSNYIKFENSSRSLIKLDNSYIKNLKKKKKYKLLSALEVTNFLYSYFNKNFYFFFKQNFIDYKFYNLFYEIMFFQKKYKIFGKFSSIFFLYFSLFIFYKKPSLFMDGVYKIYEDITRDEQIGMHYILFKIQKYIPKGFLIKNNIIGIQIKLKGQFCRRAGERRQTKYYRLGKFSTSNPMSKYIIAYSQLNNWSGAVGWTIVLRYK